MPTLEYCIEHADTLAKEVAASWAVHYKHLPPDKIPADFKALLDASDQYQIAKKTADDARVVFGKVCKEYMDKHGGVVAART